MNPLISNSSRFDRMAHPFTDIASRAINSDFQGMDESSKKRFFSVPSDSLLGMAMYDFDTMSSSKDGSGLIPRYNTGSMQYHLRNSHHMANMAPAFHPVDEYKDLSLKEILDLTDDFLLPDQEFGQNSERSLFQPIPVRSFMTDTIGERHDSLLGRRHEVYIRSAANLMNRDVDNAMVTPTSIHSSSVCMIQRGDSKHELPPDDLEEMAKISYYRNQENVDNFVASDELFDEENIVSDCSETIVPMNTYAGNVTDEVVSTSNKRSYGSVDADGYDSGCDGSVCDDSDDNGCFDPSDRRFRPYQAGQWSEKFAELCEYNKEMGHCLVPHTYTENLALARWVKRQRYQYKLMVEGKSSTMTEDRVKALDDIGFVWDSQGAAWGDRLHELQTFKREFHHCNVPSNYSENPRLATWIKCQRRQYKLYCESKASNMTPQRIHELEKLGFEWELRCYKKPRTT